VTTWKVIGTNIQECGPQISTYPTLAAGKSPSPFFLGQEKPLGLLDRHVTWHPRLRVTRRTCSLLPPLLWRSQRTSAHQAAHFRFSLIRTACLFHLYAVRIRSRRNATNRADVYSRSFISRGVDPYTQGTALDDKRRKETEN
jgi:hypothetical protein